MNSTHKKEQTKTDSTSHVKKDSSGQSKTVIQEKGNIDINLKGDTAKAKSSIDNLKKQDIHIDNGKTVLDVHLNDTTGILTATAITKPRKIHKTIDRTTTTTQSSKVSTNASNEVKKETKVNDTTKSVQVTKKPGISWYWWLIGALILLTVAYFTLRYFKL